MPIHSTKDVEEDRVALSCLIHGSQASSNHCPDAWLLNQEGKPFDLPCCYELFLLFNSALDDRSFS